jgi:hypothetical protein
VCLFRFFFSLYFFKGWSGWLPTARIERLPLDIEYFPNLSISSSRRGWNGCAAKERHRVMGMAEV